MAHNLVKNDISLEGKEVSIPKMGEISSELATELNGRKPKMISLINQKSSK
jgi:hypothetical protein